MFNPRAHRVVIVACLTGKLPLPERFGRHRRATRRLSALLEVVVAQMEPALVTSLALVRYPWCFVAPDIDGDGQHYFVGAFLPPPGMSGVPREMLYARVSEIWLLAHLHSPVGLPLWLSRTLIPLINGVSLPLHSEEIRQTCAFLQRYLTPQRHIWRKNTPQAQDGQLEKLNAVRCDADEMLRSQCGVDAMPWIDWPHCIQHHKTIWLWRQSRHGKVIESQKVIIEKNHN